MSSSFMSNQMLIQKSNQLSSTTVDKNKTMMTTPEKNDYASAESVAKLISSPRRTVVYDEATPSMASHPHLLAGVDESIVIQPEASQSVLQVVEYDEADGPRSANSNQNKQQMQK